MQNVIGLIVIMLNVVSLNVIIQTAIMLKVTAPATYRSVGENSDESGDEESGNGGRHVGDAHQHACVNIQLLKRPLLIAKTV